MAGGNNNTRSNPVQKFMITGTTVVMEMASGGLFMENVKIEKQRTSRPYPRIMRDILAQGMRGFQGGLLPWGVILGFSKGSVLGGAKAVIDNYLVNDMSMDKRKAAYLAGPMAGAVQGVFMSPLLLMRTRVNQAITQATEAGRKVTIGEQFGVFGTMVKEEGVMSLTKGMPLFICKRALDWGTRFVFLQWMREGLKARKAEGEALNDLEKLGTAFMAGAASVAVTVPVDRLAPVIQAAGSEAKDGIVPFIRQKIAQEGMGTMFRGFIMRTIHTGYHTVFAIFLADKIGDLMGGSGGSH